MSNQDIYLIDQLRYINNVYTNSIPSKQIHVNAPHTRTPLLQHQHLLIDAMNQHHLRMTRGYVWDNQIIHSKMGVIGDPPGTGKSLSILSYISSLVQLNPVINQNINQNINPTINPTIPYQGGLVDNSNRYFYSNHIETFTDASSTHLVIVPHYLFHQWKDQIENHTTLQCFFLNNKRILRNNTTPELMCNSHFILTTNKMYKNLYDFSKQHKIRWKHIFIDEAANIHFTVNDPQLEFQFLWFITNNWLGFIFKNMWISPSNLHYIHDRIENLHPDTLQLLTSYMDNNQNIYTNMTSSSFFKTYIPYGHPARSQLILLNSKESLQTSFTLPDIRTITTHCHQPHTLGSLRQIANLTLTSETVPRLLSSLDVQYLTLEQCLEYHSDRATVIWAKSTDDCSICLEQPNNRILIKCCMNTFCGGCIIRHMLTSTVCPTCRTQISIGDIICLNNVLSEESRMLTRQEACLDYIRQHSNESIIIYTIFENTYYQLMPELDRAGIECERLNINMAHQILNDFNTDKIKVLFVSNPDILHGINLTKARHLIFFSEQPFYDQRQLLIYSAQRLNRLTPLTVLQLQNSDQ